VGLTTRPAFTAVSCLWWCAVAVGGIRLLVRPVRVQWRWDAPVVALLLVAAVGVQWQGDRRFTHSDAVVADRCSSTQPVVCVRGEYSSRLATYTAPATRLAQALGRLDPAVQPARIEQIDATHVAGGAPTDSTVRIVIDPQGRPDLVNLALELVESASGCPRANLSPSERLFDDEQRLVGWLLPDAGLGPDPALAPGQAVTSASQAGDVLTALRTEC
jgi:hypothetical protein